MLPKDRFNRIVELLLPEMGETQTRRALVEAALYGCAVLQKITWEGPAHAFTVHLVRTLDTFGEIAPGQPAIAALLEALRPQVGAAQQTDIARLLAGDAPSIKLPTPAPSTHSAPGELQIFLSYARPDQAVAERVEAFLIAAGIRVFRDVSDIRPGENWDLAIEAALRECQSMVLLLSPASMPDRKEVHREWFRFDQRSKTIYPLYLQDCELHSRFDSRNYIDARTDLQAALDRLLQALLADGAPV
jgi:hypothetical protein